MEVLEKRKPGRPKTTPLLHGVPPAEGLNIMRGLERNQIADRGTAGDIERATKDFLDGDPERVSRDDALKFASIEHSIIGGPRILAWLLKIEELGMQGNLKAFEILLDRCFGKVTETIAVAHGEFEGMKDGELLKELQSIKGLYSPKPTDSP